MINPFKDVNWQPDLAARRQFGVSLMLGFPILAAIWGVIGRLGTGIWNPSFLWLAGIGLATGVVVWLLPQIAKPLYLAWYFAACSIGLVVGNLLLGLLFYAVVTPIGVLQRIAGRSPLRKGFDRTASTYWEDAKKITEAGRYYRQF